MEFVMNVPRLFDVKINQFEKFLLNNGWKRDQEYFDSLSRFTPIKKDDIQIVLPANEDVDLLDKQIIIRRAVETLTILMSENLESMVETINIYEVE